MPKHCSIYVFNATYELNQFSFFDISSDKPFFQIKPSSFLESQLYQSLSKDPKLKVTCYFSGTFLESLKERDQEIQAIKSLVANGQIELLLGTYYYSFSCLFSSAFFDEEMSRHKALIYSIFGVRPAGFLNTAAIFSNDLLATVNEVSYVVAPRVGWYLDNEPYLRAVKAKDGKMGVFLVGDSTEDQDLIVSYLPGFVSRHWDLDTITASEAMEHFQKEKQYSLPSAVAIDPEGKDLNHFMGNTLQRQVFKQINYLSEKIFKSKDEKLKSELMILGAPAIFDLISSEYNIRYDYYTSLMNCLTDLEIRLD